jgi:hypothetical protein
MGHWPYNMNVFIDNNHIISDSYDKTGQLHMSWPPPQTIISVS